MVTMILIIKQINNVNDDSNDGDIVDRNYNSYATGNYR